MSNQYTTDPLYINNAQYSGHIYYSSMKDIEFNQPETIVYCPNSQDVIEDSIEEGLEDQLSNTKIKNLSKNLSKTKNDKSIKNIKEYNCWGFWKIYFVSSIFLLFILQFSPLSFYRFNNYNDQIYCILNSTSDSQTCAQLSVLPHIQSAFYNCGELTNYQYTTNYGNNTNYYGNICPSGYSCDSTRTIPNIYNENNYCVLDSLNTTHDSIAYYIDHCSLIDTQSLFVPIDKSDYYISYLDIPYFSLCVTLITICILFYMFVDTLLYKNSERINKFLILINCIVISICPILISIITFHIFMFYNSIIETLDPLIYIYDMCYMYDNNAISDLNFYSVVSVVIAMIVFCCNCIAFPLSIFTIYGHVMKGCAK